MNLQQQQRDCHQHHNTGTTVKNSADYPLPCVPPRVLQADKVEELVDERSYTSSRIRSSPHVSFLTGRIEARIKLPAGLGLWAAFWMLPANSTRGNWAATGEIDIMEVSYDLTVTKVCLCNRSFLASIVGLDE